MSDEPEQEPEPNICALRALTLCDGHEARTWPDARIRTCYCERIDIARRLGDVDLAMEEVHGRAIAVARATQLSDRVASSERWAARRGGSPSF